MSSEGIKLGNSENGVSFFYKNFILNDVKYLT
ncbi:Hypothetical protein SSA_0920 [Streptococcus sanguinis SK36]|uniref:Uncharacterized protein n=1 Tax=Streptococcus sanguinis (strain SK36) TaxID=388919 RepID=A3CMD8_STRSV|nr:Hypothetical protein SSA_0920 [Streptococcus sanguinis SK36]